MKEPKEIIYNYLLDTDDLTPTTESLLRFFSEDDIVDWFVYGIFARDDNDIIQALGEEDARIVIDHYEAHCM